MHGGWLIAIVGTESLVILGTLVAPPLGQFGTAIFVLIHMLWGVGLALYGIFIVLFAHRIFFLEFDPDDITPLLWVVMGAAAISTNAGSTLILTDSSLPFLQSMRPFIDGVTLIMWAWGTWWIPAADCVRHLEARRVPRADPLYADAVELGLPARHVCAGEPPIVVGHRLPAAALDLADDGLGGAGGLGGHCGRVLR